MGYYNTVTGEIEIKPVVSHAKMVELIKNDLAREPSESYYTGDKDVHVDYNKLITNHDDGFTTTFRGWAIVGREDSYKAYEIVDHVQEVVDILGTEVYRYLGDLEITGEESGDLWRIRVVDGKAVIIHPTIIWPDPVVDSQSS